MCNRPVFVDDKYLSYLDDLRESGITNMYGARPYLQREFPELSDETSAEILVYWIKTFEKSDR